MEIKTSGAIFDGMTEKIIECEFLLPDYCQDISRVIKAEAVPRIKNQIIGEDTLSIEGLIEFRVFYISEGTDILNCINYANEYSLTFDIKGISDNSYILLKPITKNTLCRVVNSRKLSPKTQLYMGAKVFEYTPIEIMEPQNNEIQTRCCDYPLFNVVSHTVKPVLISDNIEISGLSASSVLKNNIRIACDENKLLNDKIVVRGTAYITTLYVDINGEISQNEGEIPFTQIIDIENTNEHTVCDIKYSVCDCMCILKENEKGENGLLSVDIEARALVRAYTNSQCSVVTDAYSTKKAYDFSRKKLYIESLVCNVHEEFIERLSFENVDVLKTVDIYPTASISQISLENNEIIAEGIIDVTLLYYNSDMQLLTSSKQFNFKRPIKIKEGYRKLRFEPDIEIISADCQALDKEAEIRISMSLTGMIFSGNDIEAITGMQDSDNTDNSQKAYAVTLYFAKKGENLWNIAKRYCSTVDEIASLNELDNEVLSYDKMLIIP